MKIYILWATDVILNVFVFYLPEHMYNSIIGKDLLLWGVLQFTKCDVLNDLYDPGSSDASSWRNVRVYVISDPYFSKITNISKLMRYFT